MSWTIISVRAPAYMVEDSHNRPFRTIDNGRSAPERSPSEMTLRITTSHFPKDPSVGFVFGCDRKTCDVLLPCEGGGISNRQFAITFRPDCGAVILRNLSKNLTLIDDEVGLRKLVREMCFGEHAIRVRLPKLDIELERPWNDDEITSPLYTSFLAKLPNPDGMRPASSTGATMGSSTSRSQDGYRQGNVLV